MLLALITAAGCAARRPTRSFSELPQRLHRGNSVYVLDDAGTETQGKVMDIAPSALILDIKGVPRRFEEPQVRQVQRYGDSLWNGILIGAGTGAFIAAFSDARYAPCKNDPLKRCADNEVALRVLSVPLFGAAGAGIDALIRHREPVYLAPAAPSNSRTRITISPMFLHSTFGLSATYRLR